MFRLIKKSEKSAQQLDQEIKKHNKKMLKITEDNLLGMPASIVQEIAGYAVDIPWVLNKSIFFSGADCTLQQILFLAEYAGPLKEFQFLVGELIKKEKLAYEAKKIANPNEIENYILINRIFHIGKRHGTFIQCLVSGLDTTVGNEKGMAECFIAKIEELLPHKLPVVLEQAQQASELKPDEHVAILKEIIAEQKEQHEPSIEDEKSGSERESTNSTTVKQFFDALTQNDKMLKQALAENNREMIIQAISKLTDEKQAIFIFKTFVNGRQYDLINNLYLYYENLTHLIDVFYEVSQLAKKSYGELPVEQRKMIDRNCFHIMCFFQETINLAAVKQLFDAFKNGNKYVIECAIENFQQFVEGTKRLSLNQNGYMKNNQFYKNLIHLLHAAVYELVRRCREIRGGWDSENANLFCVKVLGGVLQSELPPHVQQCFRWQVCGISGVFKDLMVDRRVIDQSGQLFLTDSYDSGPNNKNNLGDNFYFGLSGPSRYAAELTKREEALGEEGISAAIFYKTYYDELSQNIDIMLQLQPDHHKRSRCSLM